jgi:pimeloyl-ACP methyl ester carboxylesterase
MSNPATLAFRTRGRGDPLVLIMGLGADGTVWEEHVKAYEQHFTCYLIDNRGIGGSPKPAGPYTTAQMADDVAALMAAQGIAQARVAGLSMGGAIAQELALRHPARVRSLALVSTWAKCTPYMKNVFTHFKAMRATTRLEDFMRLLQLWIWTPGYLAAHEAELAEARRLAGLAEFPQPQQGFEGQCDACIEHDTAARLGAITAPTLVTVGDQDIFTPLACSEALQQGIACARLSVFAGSGHVHHWECLERFNAETTRFLLET